VKSQQGLIPESVRFGLLMLYVACALTTIEYFARPASFSAWFPELARQQYGVYPNLWWAAVTMTAYLLPLLLIKWGYRERWADYGLNPHLKRQHLLLYGGMFLVVLPLVVLVAQQPAFLQTYPFFRQAHLAPTSTILLWESAYLLQFFALEFFFRGFLLFSLERRLGMNAVWVAMLPYCMIHFHKPPLEAFGAIIAGLVLGYVALRTRSIFGGVLVHVGVAATMDGLALRAMLQ
jgi:membrane protease YdiL (CAAX protease family)